MTDATKTDAEFRERYGPWALIAGGSDGIGAAFAHEAAARGLDVALLARRAEPLERLGRRIEAEHGVATRTIVTDLTDVALAATLERETADLDVGLLVYNAGSSPKAERFLDQSVDEALFMVELNCRGPVLLAHRIGRRLRERGRGGMIFMSSLASLAGTAFQATYAASKSFDVILAEGLWLELAEHDVDVLGVLAGATRTETMLAQQPEAFESAMDPVEVARGALAHLGKGPSWVPGEANRQAARGMWPVPRVPLVNGMSQATAALFGREVAAAEGVEFDAD